jgi:hypothetical protein
LHPASSNRRAVAASSGQTSLGCAIKQASRQKLFRPGGVHFHRIPNSGPSRFSVDDYVMADFAVTNYPARVAARTWVDGSLSA